MFQSARSVRLSFSTPCQMALRYVSRHYLYPIWLRSQDKQWRMKFGFKSDNLPPIHIENGTFWIVKNFMCSHILSRPSLGHEQLSPRHGYHPLDLQPPSVAHYPSGPTRSSEIWMVILGRVIGSDIPAFFSGCDSLLIGALRTPGLK